MHTCVSHVFLVPLEQMRLEYLSANLLTMLLVRICHFFHALCKHGDSTLSNHSQKCVQMSSLQITYHIMLDLHVFKDTVCIPLLKQPPLL